MKYPQYVKVGEKKYKINTDFRVAIECDRIARDNTIGDYERVLAIIYKLFGEEGINAFEDHEKLLELGKKYLLCGKETSDDEPDMDFVEDYGYIWASIYSDYHGLDIDKENIHWWKFMDLMDGLSNSELGDCCVLNRIRNLRNFDTKDIKDAKEKQKIEEAKERVALKRNRKVATKEQQENVEQALKQLGLL